MAKIDVDDFLFECPVCIEQFDESCKMLPCQHIFCQNCLERIYEADQQPQCPTCRQRVITPILELQRPILLLTLLEKVKAESKKPKTEIVDELQLAVDESIKTYEKQQELETSTIDHEVLQLQIALSKSEQEALFQAEKQSLITEKESLEYELTLIKSGRSSDAGQIALSESEEVLEANPSTSDRVHALDFTNQVQEVECVSESAPRPDVDKASETETNLEDDDWSDAAETVMAGQFKKLSLNAESRHNVTNTDLNVPDGLLNYLTSPNQELVMKEVVTVVSNDEKLAALNECELQHYLKTVDDYLNALSCYRRNSTTMIHDGSGDTTGNACVSSVSNFCDSNLFGSNLDLNDSHQLGCSDSEDKELAYALELSRQSSMGRDEELLELTLKRSEMLGVVDKLEAQLFDIKEKLELTMVILMSEGLATN